MKAKTFIVVCLIFLQNLFLFSQETIQELKQPNDSLRTDSSDLSLENLFRILPELSKPFPNPRDKNEDMDFGRTLTKKQIQKDKNQISFNRLKRIIPEINKDFPFSLEEGNPDSKPEYQEVNVDNAWLHLNALVEAYPEIKELAFDSDVNDWFIVFQSDEPNENPVKEFFWANGRILEKDKLSHKDEYTAFFRYYYKKELFELKEKDFETFESLLANEEKEIANKKNSKTNLFLLEAIYGEISESSIKKKLEEIYVFAHPIYLHKRVAPSFKACLSKIKAIKKSGKLKGFFSNYLISYGFNWRKIENKNVLSNHAIGIAVDIMARNYGKLKSYWYWASFDETPWYKLEPSKRWKAPNKIIEAFEENGFIWGGYWMFWDTMHFEYKPELIYIQKFTYENNQELYSEIELDQGQ